MKPFSVSKDLIYASGERVTYNMDLKTKTYN